MRSLVCVVCAGLAAAACGGRAAPAPAPDEHRGLYEVGYEANHFTPCEAGSGAERWPVAIDSAQRARVQAARPAPGAFNSSAYYVRWRGRYVVTPPPSPPRIQSPGPRRFEVAEVLEARAPLRGECGYASGR